MVKKISALLLTLILSITLSATSFAATKTLEDAINEMTLSPVKTSDWPQEYMDAINSGLEDKTNYQKMKAIYDEWAGVSVDRINCVGYAAALQTAYEVLGFRTYHIRGEVTTTNGGWTPHSWVGVEVSGQLYYFDTNLPGKYKAKGNCFGVLPKDATWYRNAEIMKLYISPESLIYFSGGSCKLDADDRTDYLSVPVSSDYRPKGGGSGLKGFD
jgi:hypothetical protein